jgi:uncharacterized protein (TIGR03663 family)
MFPAERLASALGVFVVVYGLFYSSFLTNPKGLVDSLATFAVWTQTGAATQVQPLQQYIVWMLPADAVILVLGVIGGLLVAWRPRDLISVFIALWALGITLAYSIIQYKTPWIVLNMLVPLALLAGIAATEFVRRVRAPRLQTVGSIGLAAGLVASGYMALDLNFNHYDDETYPYVFVHTTREAEAMVNETKRIAAAAGSGADTGIAIMSPVYWPLPWYYRDYPKAGFFGAIVPTQEPMIIASARQENDLAATVNGKYTKKGVYTLRPGEDLILYVRNDLAAL